MLVKRSDFCATYLIPRIPTKVKTPILVHCDAPRPRQGREYVKNVKNLISENAYSNSIYSKNRFLVGSWAMSRVTPVCPLWQAVGRAKVMADFWNKLELKTFCSKPHRLNMGKLQLQLHVQSSFPGVALMPSSRSPVGVHTLKVLRTLHTPFRLDSKWPNLRHFWKTPP